MGMFQNWTNEDFEGYWEYMEEYVRGLGDTAEE